MNIEWTDEEETEGRATERSDNDVVGYMFGSLSMLDQSDVNKLVKKYNIPNFNICQAPKVENICQTLRARKFLCPLSILRLK